MEPHLHRRLDDLDHRRHRPPRHGIGVRMEAPPDDPQSLRDPPARFQQVQAEVENVPLDPPQPRHDPRHPLGGVIPEDRVILQHDHPLFTARHRQPQQRQVRPRAREIPRRQLRLVGEQPLIRPRLHRRETVERHAEGPQPSGDFGPTLRVAAAVDEVSAIEIAEYRRRHGRQPSNQRPGRLGRGPLNSCPMRHHPLRFSRQTMLRSRRKRHSR
jgi:hypothetical protein